MRNVVVDGRVVVVVLRRPSVVVALVGAVVVEPDVVVRRRLVVLVFLVFRAVSAGFERAQAGSDGSSHRPVSRHCRRRPASSRRASGPARRGAAAPAAAPETGAPARGPAPAPIPTPPAAPADATLPTTSAPRTIAAVRRRAMEITMPPSSPEPMGTAEHAVPQSTLRDRRVDGNPRQVDGA
jgi:hypothetical protein